MKRIQKSVNRISGEWIRKTVLAMIVLGTCLLGNGIAAAEPDASPPFVEGSRYDQNVPSPESILGYAVGSRLATVDEIHRYYQALSDQSKHVQLRTYGQTHEGRDLVTLVVSSPENMALLDVIREQIGRLADPAKLSRPEEAEEIIRHAPAIAWLGYSIHGDETSPADAAVWVAYQLAAGQDEVTQDILKNVVVCIDPLQNPDGRERYLAQMRMFGGKVANPDVQSAQHRGAWPWGRGNHYFFDLNRDFFILSQPESRARVKAFQEWNPQLFVDSHEMGPLDTYLFSPAREPFNPNFTDNNKRWHRVFAEDQSRAFDHYGWNYYTREWVDMWYPGYTDSITYRGAVMILYEQAGVDGSLVKRPDGTTMTYREAVHHNVISTMANLETLARRRSEILTDFYQGKKTSLQPPAEGDATAFLIEPSPNPSRDRRLLENLLAQGFEIYQANAAFTARSLVSRFSQNVAEKEFPAGTWIIPLQQPLRRLLHAVFDFDPPMTDTFLKEERFYLEKKDESRMYDVSAWSMPIAYSAECYEARSPIRAARQRVTEAPPLAGQIPDTPPQYGFVLDGMDDAATHAVSRLL